MLDGKFKIHDSSYSEAIRRLKQHNLTSISILTDDNCKNAEELSSELGIDRIYSNCTIDRKIQIINDLKKFGTVMIIGDGLNDISDLRIADISLSFSNCSYEKLKQSDYIFLKEDISRLPELIELYLPLSIIHNFSTKQMFCEYNICG